MRADLRLKLQCGVLRRICTWEECHKNLERTRPQSITLLCSEWEYTYFVKDCIDNVLIKAPVLEDCEDATRSSARIRAPHHVRRNICSNSKLVRGGLREGMI